MNLHTEIKFTLSFVKLQWYSAYLTPLGKFLNFCLKALSSLEWKLCLMCSNKKILQLKKWAIKSKESFNEACKISCMKSISLAYNRTRKFFLYIWITIWLRQQQHNSRRRKILISSCAINCATKQKILQKICL